MQRVAIPSCLLSRILQSSLPNQECRPFHEGVDQGQETGGLSISTSEQLWNIGKSDRPAASAVLWAIRTGCPLTTIPVWFRGEVSAQYPAPWSNSLQEIPTSAAPDLDFVDFVASKTAVSLKVVAELAKIPEFSAAISAYRSLLILGYCGFFCWPTVRSLFKELTEEQLLDYLRIAAYCDDLPTDDERHINLDFKSAKERFPILFRIDDFPVGPQRASYASLLLVEMGPFAAQHEFRTMGFSGVRGRDEDQYITCWMSRSEDQIAKYMENPRFCAGLDAFGLELLSFHGFLEKVFGLDYYDNVLVKNQYALFQGLRSDLTGRVIVKLANQVLAGERPIAPDLRDKFPEIYMGYQPEFYGVRR
jgi:hypothetical protein